MWCVCVYVCVSACSLAWHGETNWFVFTPLLRTQRGLLGNCQSKPVSLMHASAGLPLSLSVCVQITTSMSRASGRLCVGLLYACSCMCMSVCEGEEVGRRHMQEKQEPLKNHCSFQKRNEHLQKVFLLCNPNHRDKIFFLRNHKSV